VEKSLKSTKEVTRMKTKRYSSEQIIGILKEGEAGMSVNELCRK